MVKITTIELGYSVNRKSRLIRKLSRKQNLPLHTRNCPVPIIRVRLHYKS